MFHEAGVALVTMTKTVQTSNNQPRVILFKHDSTSPEMHSRAISCSLIRPKCHAWHLGLVEPLRDTSAASAAAVVAALRPRPEIECHPRGRAFERGALHPLFLADEISAKIPLSVMAKQLKFAVL
jgi:hypothetical protein